MMKDFACLYRNMANLLQFQGFLIANKVFIIYCESEKNTLILQYTP